MESLREVIKKATISKSAIGHFNFATLEMLRGIVEGAKEMGVPVIVGASEGERDFMGDKETRAMVSAFRDHFNIPIFLNADHTKSFEKAKIAIEEGFDSVVVDGSAYSLTENIAMVRKVVEFAKDFGREIVIEAELGFIGISSEVFDGLPPGVMVDESHLTLPEDAKRLIEETGADLFAPAVGNVHGIIKVMGNPPLSIKRIREIREVCGVPLVLHGASGVAENDVKEAIKAGVSIVHFSTDLRLAFRNALVNSISDNKDEMSPYKYLRESIKSVKDVVRSRISWLS